MLAGAAVVRPGDLEPGETPGRPDEAATTVSREAQAAPTGTRETAANGGGGQRYGWHCFGLCSSRQEAASISRVAPVGEQMLFVCAADTKPFQIDMRDTRLRRLGMLKTNEMLFRAGSHQQSSLVLMSVLANVSHLAALMDVMWGFRQWHAVVLVVQLIALLPLMGIANPVVAAMLCRRFETLFFVGNAVSMTVALCAMSASRGQIFVAVAHMPSLVLCAFVDALPGAARVRLGIVANSVILLWAAAVAGVVFFGVGSRGDILTGPGGFLDGLSWESHCISSALYMTTFNMRFLHSFLLSPRAFVLIKSRMHIFASTRKAVNIMHAIAETWETGSPVEEGYQPRRSGGSGLEAASVRVVTPSILPFELDFGATVAHKFLPAASAAFLARAAFTFSVRVLLVACNCVGWAALFLMAYGYPTGVLVASPLLPCGVFFLGCNWHLVKRVTYSFETGFLLMNSAIVFGSLFAMRGSKRGDIVPLVCHFLSTVICRHFDALPPALRRRVALGSVIPHAAGFALLAALVWAEAFPLEVATLTVFGREVGLEPRVLAAAGTLVMYQVRNILHMLRHPTQLTILKSNVSSRKVTEHCAEISIAGHRLLGTQVRGLSERRL